MGRIPALRAGEAGVNSGGERGAFEGGEHSAARTRSTGPRGVDHRISRTRRKLAEARARESAGPDGKDMPGMRHQASAMNSGGRFTPALLLLFVGSGCSALIYEVVWFHLLRLVVGASALSLGVLLASFMGGMCLGSLAFSRVVSSERHPLRVYAVLELGIGLIGLAMPFVMPLVTKLYLESVGRGMGSTMVRAAVATLCLLPPTILMGATLPAIARWMETTREGLSRLGFFYGANIAGAVIGTIAAGFYLLRVYDTMIATYVAATINFVVAAIGLLLATRSAHVPAAAPAPAGASGPIQRIHPVTYVAILLSGLTALGAEVVWTRLLALLYGASVYTFSLVLAVFLVGLGIGSGIASWMTGWLRRPRLALGIAQLLICAAIGYAAWAIIGLLPRLQAFLIFQPEVTAHMGFMYFYDFMRTLLAFLPATILWGASFPLALSAVGSRDADTGRLVGRVYAANTVGAILGATLVSFLGFTEWGSQRTEQGLIVLAGVSAGLMFLSVMIRPDREDSGLERLVAAACGGAALLLVFLSVGWARAVPEGMIAYGRFVDEWDKEADYLYAEEGQSASVAVSVLPNGVRNFHVSGKIVASTEPIDMRLQRMLGHLPGLLHGNPKSALIVGCGAAVTAGCFVDYPNLERIVICEIEPKVVEAARQWFPDENRRVLVDERTEIIFDDARHFMATTNEKFDIITSDPIHPWVKGAAALYSAEYYDLVKDRLNPGGIVTQWVPLYQTNETSVKSQVGTFFHERAFPFGTLWNSDPEMIGYDIVMLGGIGPMRIDVDDIQRRMDMEELIAVKEALAEIEVYSAIDLMKTYLGQAPDMKPWLAGAPINDDRSLRLQYLAGMALDRYEDESIFSGMVEYRVYPEKLFVADIETEAALRLDFIR
jgi:spermidine synthase